MEKQTWGELKAFLKEDRRRNGSYLTILFRPKHALLFWFRLCAFAKSRKWRITHILTKIMFKLHQYITGIHMDEYCKMGGG